MIGIYKIVINEKAYVGSSFNLDLRIKQHKSDLKCNRHCNQHLQAAYNRYKDIKIEIIETFDNITDEDLRKIENFWKNKIGYYNIQDPETHFGLKTIYQFDLKGNLLKKFTSVYDAAKALNISVSNIRHAAEENEKLTRTAGGYFWRYTPTITITDDNRKTKIYVYNIDGYFINEYDSYIECSEKLGIKQKYFTNVIANICKGVCASWNGYRFSTIKVKKLDNSNLLKIKKNFPVVQISIDGKQKIKTWNTATAAAKYFKVQSCTITDACNKNKIVKGYQWTRLGTKLSELLETPENIETKAELETINENV